MTFFGSALRDALAAHRLSQSGAAERADLDHSYVCRLVSGQRSPSREAIDRIVEGCGFDPVVARELYEAAGFLPSGSIAAARTLIREDSLLQDVAHTLGDESIALPYRENLRRQITALVGVTRQMVVAP